MKYNILAIALCSLLFSSVSSAEEMSLQQELTPKITNDQVEIRAYKSEDGATMTEYKTAGKVWMIKVQPAGNFPAYYLYDEEGNGNFERRIMGNKIPSAPMWIIKEF